ncbi:MAG TPA: DUF2203 domain-containing protein [Trueperaceae bacterium]
MYKLFTIQEAQGLIPVVDRNLREMQSGINDALGVQEALKKAQPFSIEARNLSEELNFLLTGIQQNKAELDRMGVHLQDIDAGLVNFPSQLGAEVVYLCWEQGQEAITHYHTLGEHESDRHPLPETSKTPASI